jgi:hemolysin activation/secretion protein
VSLQRAAIHFIIITLAAFLISFYFVSSARAQETIRGVIPNISDPGVAQKRLITQPEEPSVSAQPGLKLPAAAKPAGFSDAAKIKFKLTQIILEGNKTFSNAELSKLYSDSINKQISLAELQDIVDKITNYYRNKGYILSRAVLPAQRIKNGVVTIKILEGYIAKVTVEGHPDGARRMVQKFGDNVLCDVPIQMKTLERNLLLANDIPGANVKAVITPSTTQTGAADLALVTQHKVAGGYLSYDNYGTKYLGPNQYGMGVNVNSLLTSGDTTVLRGVVTKETKELKFVDLSHALFLGCSGMRLLLDGNYTKTNPGFLLDPVDLVGENKAASANLSYPVIRSRTKNLNIYAYSVYQNTVSTILDERFYADRIRAALLGIHFDFVDSWRGANSITLTTDRGFNIWGATNAGEHSRLFGQGNYRRANLYVSRLQYISPRITLFVASQGQFAWTPLYAGQQFAYGGPDFGRGYDPAELIGDRGVGAKAELRVSTEPGLTFLQSVQYYGFYDIGGIWNILPELSGQPGKLSAASTGIGAYITINKYFYANVFFARPLTRKVLNLVAAGENGRQIRPFLQVIFSI